MKVTVEFDEHDEDQVVGEIVTAAAASLKGHGMFAIEQAVHRQLGALTPVIAERARTLVDEALEDEAIGLPALIMQRVSREIHDSLPARIDQLVNAALTRIAVQQIEVEKAERERRRGPFRRRQN